MCGIIGYIGEKEAYSILLKGLEPEPLPTGQVQVEFINSQISGLNMINKDLCLLDYIKPEDYYVQITKNCRELLNSKVANVNAILLQLQISRATLSRIRKKEGYWCNLKTVFDLGEILSIEKRDILSNIECIKTHNSFPINFNNNNFISPSLFRIIGHLLGDGGIHVIEKEGKYRAFYTNNQQVLLDSFSEDVKAIFGEVKLYCRARILQGDEVWLPTTLGVFFYNLLSYKELNKKKRVPKFILETNNKEFLGTFLQALYDDEGFLYPQKRMIVIAQKSLELVNDIREIVLKLGITPNKLLIHKSKSRTTMHYFSITKRENFVLFDRYIGFKHPLKKEKLKILLTNYKEK